MAVLRVDKLVLDGVDDDGGWRITRIRTCEAEQGPHRVGVRRAQWRRSRKLAVLTKDVVDGHGAPA